MTEMGSVRVVIRGRVQGVGFRAWTAAEARRHGLAGWVRNRADGSVEAVFQGAPDELGAMLAACRHGPAHARVESVDQEDQVADAERAGKEAPEDALVFGRPAVLMPPAAIVFADQFS